MPRPARSKLVTANSLLIGDVIYLTADDQWSRDPSEAEVIDDDAHAQLRLLFAESDAHVVGAYLADAELGPNGPNPLHLREAMRGRGPSNYLHGKQEAQDVSV